MQEFSYKAYKKHQGAVLALLLAFWLPLASAWAAPGYALWGDLKYPPGFAHFSYLNPDAPKGGELRLVSNLRVSTFDKYNPFTIKGSAPAYLSELMFDTLLAGPLDESAAGYGLLAQSVEVSADGLSATFILRPEARFHNGYPVMAQDVRHTYESLIGPYASPGYKTLLEDVAGVDVVADKVVRFRFKKPNRELPLTVGGLPIFSRSWGHTAGQAKAKRFDEIVTDTPIGSGPYIIGPVRFGKDITYVRNPNYWAKDLNVRRGSYNFDRISVKIYRDNTARLEALKAGEFDVMQFYSAGDWARRVTGRKFDSGELLKAEFKHGMPTGFQSAIINVRKPKFADVRLREALGLAVDYEWMNRQLFYGAYQRVQGLFGNTDCAAGNGPPETAEIALLEPWRSQIPGAVFGPMAQPPRTEGDGNSLRSNLRRARDLLAAAGWNVDAQGVLRNVQGQALTIDYLDSNEAGARTITPWARNLEKLGIKLNYRVVDFALYQQRLATFDFDMTTINFPGTSSPGQEYADIFGSQAADTPDSGNYAGVKSKAVDALVQSMTAASTKAELLPACRALERLISHSHYLIPQWTAGTHRLAFNQQRLARQEPMPPYARGDGWVINAWWAKQ